MADESNTLIQSLNARVNELTAKLAETTQEAKTRRIANKKLSQQVEELTASNTGLTKDRDEWKVKAEGSPNEWKTKAEDLTSQIRSRDHRDAWKETIGSTLNDKVPIEEVWAKIGYKPGDTLPTAEEINEHVGKARDAAPYLFRKSDEQSDASGEAKNPTKPPLNTDWSGSRGARDTTGKRVTVKKADLANPTFALNPVNKKMIAEARSAGVLDIVD